MYPQSPGDSSSDGKGSEDPPKDDVSGSVLSLETGQAADFSCKELYPVVRQISSSKLVAIYADHILEGTRYFRRVKLEEEMLHPHGEVLLKRQLQRTKILRFEDILEVREAVAEPGNGILKSKFVIVPRNGKTLKFSLPTAQVGSIRTALLPIGHVYSVEDEKISPWLIAIVSLILIGSVMWLIIPNNAHGCASAVAICLGGLICFGFFKWRQYRRGRQAARQPIREYLLEQRAWQAAAAPAAASSVPPFHSRILGWALKILGLTYWILVASPLTDGIAAKIGTGGGAQYLWALIWLPSAFLISYGYRLGLAPYRPSSAGDSRRPILFLRSFETDAATTLQPPGLLAGITGVRAGVLPNQWARPSQGGQANKDEAFLSVHPVKLVRMIFNKGASTAEEDLVRYFEKFGPPIAIGRPGEPVILPGAARAYLGDDEWKGFVASTLEKAQAVVVLPGSGAGGAGLRWELEQIFKSKDPHELLLCMVSFWRNPQGYEDMSATLRSALQVEPPRVVPYLDRPSFLYFDRDWKVQLQELSYHNPMIWPLTSDATDMEYSLGPFVQGMHGGNRESPRSPRWAGGSRTAAAKAAAIVLAIAVALLPVWAARSFSEKAFHLLSPTAPAKEAANRKQELLRVLEHSKVATLRGKVVPYQLEVPEALLKLEPGHEFVEHSRRSPDRHLMIQVIAHPHQDDMTLLPEQVLKRNTGEEFLESHLDFARTVHHAGVEWVETQVTAKLQGGLTVSQLVRGNSSSRGTVIFSVLLILETDTGPIYEQIAARSWATFRFGRRVDVEIEPPR